MILLAAFSIWVSFAVPGHQQRIMTLFHHNLLFSIWFAQQSDGCQLPHLIFESRNYAEKNIVLCLLQSIFKFCTTIDFSMFKVTYVNVDAAVTFFRRSRLFQCSRTCWWSLLCAAPRNSSAKECPHWSTFSKHTVTVSAGDPTEQQFSCMELDPLPHTEPPYSAAP